MNHLQKLKTAIAETMMMDEEVELAVFERETRLGADLNIDSLDLVGITIAVEDAFEIEIEDVEMELVRTVGDALDLIEGKLADRVSAE